MKFIVVACFAVLVSFGQSLPAEPLRAQASRLFADGRFVDVRDLARARLTTARDSAAWWAIAAESLVELEEFEQACAHFAKAHELDASLDPLMVRYGFALVRTGRTDDAVAWLRPFLTSSNADRRASAYYYSALAALADDKVVIARKLLNEALLVTPKNGRVLIRLAQLDLSESRLEEALAHADRALSAKPTSVAAAHTRALTLARLNRPIEAETAFARHRVLLTANDQMAALVATIPTSKVPAEVCISIAGIASNVGDRELARTWAKRALDRDPTSTRAKNMIEGLRTESRPATRKSP